MATEQWMLDTADEIIKKESYPPVHLDVARLKRKRIAEIIAEHAPASYTETVASWEAAPGAAGGQPHKPSMTYGEWCDANVLQPTMGNVDLYVSAMLSLAASPSTHAAPAAQPEEK